MRVAVRKSLGAHMPRRDQLLIERTRAATLRDTFPSVGQLHIELIFGDHGLRTPPSPQLHTLYPAAAAFFRFMCPCAECDGEFDLTEAVTELVNGSVVRKRAASSSGKLSCGGT